jgi:hypothetical protein
MNLKSGMKALLYILLIFSLALYLGLRYVIYAPFEFKIDDWSMNQYALNVMRGEYYGLSSESIGQGMRIGRPFIFFSQVLSTGCWVPHRIFWL